jgi:hypothetical protein
VLDVGVVAVGGFVGVPWKSSRRDGDDLHGRVHSASHDCKGGRLASLVCIFGGHLGGMVVVECSGVYLSEVHILLLFDNNNPVGRLVVVWWVVALINVGGSRDGVLAVAVELPFDVCEHVGCA